MLKKLSDLGLNVLKMIEEGRNPYIEIPIRSLSNIIWDERRKMLKLGEKKLKRYFFNVGTAKKFMQTFLVAGFCYDIVKENIHASIRDMFYNLKRTLGDSNENTFDEQSESNPIIVDLETALNVLREQLHLIADRKGVVAGKVKIRDRGDLIDWSKLGSGGWSIPSTVEDIEFVDVKADYVLCLPVFEKIVVKVGKEIKVMSIENVFKIFKSGKPIDVISFDEHLEPRFGRIVSMYKRKRRDGEKLVRIETVTGSIIHVSEDHKVPTLTKDGLEVKRAREITKSDLLLEGKDVSNLVSKWRELEIDMIEFFKKKEPQVLPKMMVYGEPVKQVAEKIKRSVKCRMGRKEGLYKELVNAWIKNNSMPLLYYLKYEEDVRERKNLKLYLKGSPRKNAIRAIIKFNKEFSRLIGYFAAEGHVNNHIPFWTFGREERDLIHDVENLIKFSFDVKPRKYRDKGKYSSVQIMCGNKLAGYLLSFLVGSKSSEKRIPSMLYSSTDEIKKEFLKGVILGDGYVDLKRRVIKIHTISESFANDLRLLLRFLGIPSYLQVTEVKGFKRTRLFIVSILLHHWLGNKDKSSHSLWDKAPLFLFDGKEIINKEKLGYRNLNTFTIKLKPKINIRNIFPIRVRKVELVEYDGDYIEIVCVSPFHVFMHGSGIFTHNCVEKNAGFERLHEDKFWKKHNCILIGTGGQAARGTRRLINRLHTEFDLPVYVLTDNDAYGFYIYSVIKSGSMALAHVSEQLATPDARFVGLTSSDIDDYKLQNFTIKATEMDLKRAKELLQYPWFKAKEWRKEIKLMIKRKRKAEIEALSSRGLKFLSETYLPEKIESEDFLP